jgi:hypothetical protein
MPRDEKVQWVLDVLGVDVGGQPSPSGNHADPSPAPPRGIAYRKMLLSWRNAQAKVETDLASIGQAILARDDVKQDPRFEQVQQMVAGLPKLIPAFGEKLGETLDAAMNATTAAAARTLAEEAVEIIGAYRQQLAQAAPLIAFDDLISKNLRQNAALHESLQRALASLQEELSNPA